MSAYERNYDTPFRTDTYADDRWTHSVERDPRAVGYSRTPQQEQVGYVLNTNGENLDQSCENAQRRNTFDLIGQRFGQGPNNKINGEIIPDYVREPHWSKPFEPKTRVEKEYSAYKYQDKKVYVPAKTAYDDRKAYYANPETPQPTGAEPRFTNKPLETGRKQFFTDRDAEGDLYRHAKEAADAAFLTSQMRYEHMNEHVGRAYLTADSYAGHVVQAETCMTNGENWTKGPVKSHAANFNNCEPWPRPVPYNTPKKVKGKKGPRGGSGAEARPPAAYGY